MLYNEIITQSDSVDMKINEEKLDEIVLALLQLTSFDDGNGPRAWKGQNWDVMDRLHQKGFIGDPKGKAKSIWFTDEGFKKSKELFQQHFELNN